MRNIILFCFLAIGSVTVLSESLAAQQKPEMRNPVAGDARAIREGESTLRVNCSYCHGVNGTGGVRGPSLATGRFTHGDSDAALFNIILHGVPGTLMPANDLSDDETWEVIAYLRSLQPKVKPAMTGDAPAGEKYFFGDGNCSLCHMVRGRGGRLGPDLSRGGADRSTEYLVESLREPEKQISSGLAEPGRDFPMEYDTVFITMANGQKLLGVARNEDSFSIQLMTMDEKLHLLLKKDVRSVVHERKSLMPAYDKDVLPEKQLRDLLAYFDSLHGN